MKDKDLNKFMQVLEYGRHCETCPLGESACRAVSSAAFGKERCLILVAVGEVLAFHTEEAKKAAKEFRKSPKEGNKGSGI